MSRITIDVADVRQLPKTCSMTIPEDYLDSMGHMNVMWYTHLFSTGLSGLMENLGATEAFDGSTNSGTFALESHVRYLSEVHAGHTIHIHSRMLGRSEKRFHIMHFMINGDRQDVSATFETVISFVNLVRRRTAPLPPHITVPMDRMVAESHALTWDAPVCGVMSA